MGLLLYAVDPAHATITILDKFHELEPSARVLEQYLVAGNNRVPAMLNLILDDYALVVRERS